MDKITGNIDIGKELVVGGSYCVAGLLLLLLKTGEKLAPTDQEHPHVWQDIRCAIWEKTGSSATPYSNW